METKRLNNNIIISEDFSLLKEEVSKITNKYIFICDDIVYKLYNEKINNIFNEAKFIVINHGEEYKTLSTIEAISEELLNLNITRGDTIIGLGGGVILDMAGFTAGILYRGIKFISIPTTLLAMVDASVGGKTAVDFKGFKNILGLFKDPDLVFINPKFLSTLPIDEYNCGLGEIIKYKMLDHNFNLDLDINNLIYESVKFKLTYVNEDFYDKGKRMFLNLGHTFGHHIELKHNISHGVAVLNGIKVVLELERDLGIIDDSIIKYYLNIVSKYNIKLMDIDYKPYLDLIFIDKKNINNVLNLIFIDNKFNPFIYKTTKENLYEEIKNK